MGDRGNIKIGGVYLYTHWGGSELKETLKDALIRGRERWNDEQYLARIIFCEMIKDDVEGMTGFGISSEECDNDYGNEILEVKNQEVNGVPFEDFIK